VRAAALSPVVGQSDFARLGRLTTLLPHFDPRQTLVPGIEAEPPQTLQWWPRLSAVESTLARWSLGRGKSNLRAQTNVRHPKFRTFPSKVVRGLHPPLPSTPGVGTPASPKVASPGVTYPAGLVDTQHPAVLDAHPVVSAQSQLRTCEDARP
jgi:hypothetical protein